MKHLSRRTLLAGAGLGATASVVGYGHHELTKDPPNRARVDHVYVTVVHEQSHTVDLLIMKDETPVYMRSKTFDGAEDESDPYNTGGGNFEDLPEEPAEYIIWLQLDGRRWDTFDFSEWDTLPAGWEKGNFPDAVVVGYTIGNEDREEGPPNVSLTVRAADPEQTGDK
ncbi:hypothetical protein BRC81_15810 [Halobacteriales archaeon QS_1_68_20]|nr:MAG: hypothetical protein BRC81_15810 [Halobacteriales archaeon QS_1_68_20]